MSESNEQRPSLTGSILRGALSGLISGLVMATIIAAVTPLFAMAMPALFAHATLTSIAWTGLFMTSASTLFGGVMAGKRAIFDTPHAHSGNPHMVPVSVPTVTSPGMVPVMELADSPEQATQQATEQNAPTKNWVQSTGRAEGSQNAIRQILANGSLSDKDRASAILASREASADAQATR